MRMLGLVLALAAIGWVLYQSSGGDKNSGAIPEPYQESLEKAQSVEKTVEDAARKTLRDLDNNP